jgi:hypothetical protein
VISWNPDPAAKQYQVDVSNSDGFSQLISTGRVDGTNWAPDVDYTLPTYGGRLFWRVAAVDSSGTVGSFATGSFGRPPPAAPRCKPRKSSGRKHTRGCAPVKHKKKH